MTTDRLRLFFENSAEAMLLVERDRLVDCNEAAVKLLRRETRRDLLGTHLWSLSPARQPDGTDSADGILRLLGRAVERGRERAEWSILMPDGGVLPMELYLTAVPGPDGALIHVLCRDLSDRLKLERQLRRARKMVGIRKMAADLAHDFNNLLLAILGNGALLEEAVGDDEKLGPPVAEIRDAAERASDLVRQMLSYARRTEVTRRQSDANAVLAACEEKLKTFLSEHVRLRMLPSPKALRVDVDPGRLEQVVVGLVAHTARMLAGDATVTLEACERHLGEERIGQPLDLEPGRYAMIAVSGAGALPGGVPVAAVDPYALVERDEAPLSPKLLSLREMVRRDRGDLHVCGAEGPGPTVTLYLPIVSRNGGPAVHSAVVTGSPRGTETVLFVEDEPAVSGVVAKLLERSGYRVLVAHDGEEALSMVHTETGAVDLVLTDIVMPRMGGPELVRRLRETGESPRVLFCSGYTRHALREMGAVGSEEEVLLKPFNPRDLLDGVRRVLDR